MIGPDGGIMGTYRKIHIPDGPGYEEKYYFLPGNSGFKVWDVFGTRIGVGVCWDQWYPECARAMALMGAELLFYPTAIGSEPYDADLDTRSEEHTSELQSLMRISYAVFCLKNKIINYKERQQKRNPP